MGIFAKIKQGLTKRFLFAVGKGVLYTRAPLGCSIAEFKVPKRAKTIGEAAFKNCDHLTSVKPKNGQSPKTAAEINVQ